MEELSHHLIKNHYDPSSSVNEDKTLKGRHHAVAKNAQRAPACRVSRAKRKLGI